MKSNCGIYKITNLLNNKLYVGSSVNLKSRKYNHFNDLNKNKHKNVHLQNAYNKYKYITIFKWEIIKEIEKYEDKIELKKELLKWEQYYIDILDVCNPDKGYNICKEASSKLGIKHTLESKINMSKAHKGKKLSDITKINMSKAHKGKKLSDITKIKLSNIRKGKTKSEEFKQKCRKNNLGKKLSEETKNKISSNNPHRIKVKNLDTGEVFNSIKEASIKYSLKSSSGISEVCSGKKETAAGFKWSYIN